MDPAWDHTENEDKLLLTHTSRMDRDMSQDMDSDMYGTDNVSRGGCNVGNMGSGDRLISLNTEFGKHLSSVVVNNVNKCNIKYYIDDNILFDLYLYNLFSNLLKYKFPHYYSIVSGIISNIKSSLYCYINILSFILSHLNHVVSYIHIISTIFHCVHSEIRNLAKCLKCYVDCVKSAFKCYITKLILDVECIIEIGKNGEYLQNLQVSIQTCTDEFEKSICNEIAKLKSICFYPAPLFSIRNNLNKVIKLMTSNKNRLSQFKSSISIHNIENLMTCINLNCEMMDIIKSEISSLIVYVHDYGLYFNSICCYISCLKSAFCKSVQKLQTFTNVQILEMARNLECQSINVDIHVTCEIPDFSHITKQIESLNCIIQCHESDLHIYDCEIEQCLSCINCDYGSLKVYSDCIQDQILWNGYMSKVLFKCSLQSLSTHLIKINTANNNRLIKDIGVPETNNLVMSVMSTTVIDESIFVISRLYMYSKTKSEIDETLKVLKKCVCMKIYDRTFKVGVKDIQLPDATHENDNPHLKLHINNKKYNEDNKLCLCLVVRYILLNDLYVLIRYNEYLYKDMLSCMSRSYKKYSYSMTYHVNSSKLIMLTITTMDKIIRWMKNRFIEDNSDLPYTIRCFCRNVNNSYYSYLVSIILLISSLIENIWTMDTESVRMTIECVSSLLSEYQSIHVYTNYYSPSRYNTLRKIVSGLVNAKLSKNTIIYENVSRKTKTVVESSMRSYVSSVRRFILRTDFSKDKFTLLYGKYSRMSFYTQNFNIITKGRMRTMKNMGMEISLKYLDDLCKEECDQTCCQKNGLCKICPITKIKINCLCISIKIIEFVLSNVSGDVLLNYLIESVDRSRDFITNLCVGFGEVYTIMLKNPLINNDHVLRNYGNTGVTNVETRNWGYDTRYEHDVTNDRGFSKGDGYPHLTFSIYRTHIHSMSGFMGL